MNIRLLITILALGAVQFSLGANDIELLRRKYDQAENDSLRAQAALALGDFYENFQIDEAIKWGGVAVAHARKFNDAYFLVKVLNHSSAFYNRKGDFNKQIKICLEALQIAEKNKYFELQGGLSSNIGSAYVSLEDGDQAIKWLNKAIELKEKYSTPDKLATSISILGSYYFQIENYEEAIRQHQRSLEIRRTEGEDDKIAYNLANLADCYIMLKNYEKAEELYLESLQIKKRIKDEFGQSKTYLHFSWMHGFQKNYQIAVKYADSAYQIASKNSFDDQKHDAALQLAELYNSLGLNDKAYKYQREAYIIWQELNSQEASKNLNQLRTVYETDKYESENMILRKDGEIQRLVITGAIGGLFVLVIMVFFLNKWNKEKRRKNEQLSEQKKLVEEKNREILDSINYAKRIQAAILPPLRMLNELLGEAFVFYRPKDVVAGDFYWLEQKDDTILFAVADCTGHGVPGALVSVFCNNGLNRSVREKDLLVPGEILDHTRGIVLNEFEKSDEDVNDGMDIALCSLKGNKLSYSGAHNPLWIIRKGEVIEYRGDKQPIGRFENKLPFRTYEIELETDDMLYLFTDGIIDQFGGTAGKKLKSVNFKNFLLSISDLPIRSQEEALNEYYKEWKGEYEQVDDICVLALRYV